jgi:hypothetical protein
MAGPGDNTSNPSTGNDINFDVDKFFNDINKGVENIFTRNTKEFFTSFKEAFGELETQVINVGREFGGSRDLAESIRSSMAGARASVEALGGTFKDVAIIQMGVIKGLQTQTILNQEAYQDIYAIGELIGDGIKTTQQTTEKLVKDFVNVGYGLYDISNQMTGILNTARSLGVTATATYAQLSSTISQLNVYNFDNGVQGMAKMAANAAALRIDMKSTLDFAEKVFKPEDAVQTAAAFQRLGVQVQELLDPYALMDMARNDPERLQEAVVEASRSLTEFDEISGRVRIAPGAQEQLRELASTIGISKEDLAKMAINSETFSRKLSEIKFPSQFANEDDRKMIANMAQFKDGRYVITFDEQSQDAQGKLVINSVTKAVSELNEQDMKNLERINEPQKSVADLQKEANGDLKNIRNQVTAMVNILGTRAAASSRLNRGFVEVAQQVSPAVTAIGSAFGADLIDRGDKTGFLSTKRADIFVQDKIDFIVNSLKGLADGTMAYDDVMSNLRTSLTNAGQDLVNSLRGIGDLARREFERRRALDANYGGQGPAPQYRGLESIINGITPAPQINRPNNPPRTPAPPPPPPPPQTINLNLNINSNIPNISSQLMNDTAFREGLYRTINQTIRERANLAGTTA